MSTAEGKANRVVITHNNKGRILLLRITKKFLQNNNSKIENKYNIA